MEGIRDALEDLRLVVEDEVKAEVEDGERLRFLSQPGHRLGQRFPFVVDHEGQQRGQPGVGGGHGRCLPVVVLGADVEMAVDEPWQHEAAAGIDDAIGRGQKILRADGGDPVALDSHGRLHDVGGGDDLAATHDGVDARHALRTHRWVSFSVTGWSKVP